MHGSEAEVEEDAQQKGPGRQGGELVEESAGFEKAPPCTVMLRGVGGV